MYQIQIVGFRDFAVGLYITVRNLKRCHSVEGDTIARITINTVLLGTYERLETLV